MRCNNDKWIYLKNNGPTFYIRDNSYSSCIGMIKYLNDKFDLRGINYSMFDTSLLKKDKRKNVLNDYLCEKIESYVNNN